MIPNWRRPLKRMAIPRTRIMLKKLISIMACITIALAALGAMATGEPSLKDQILAIDKE